MKGEGRKLIEYWKNNGKEIIFYSDMDGVLADFEGAANLHGMPCVEYKMMPEAYLKLKPYPHAFEILDAIEEQLGIKVRLLTKIPDENPYAATEKLLWLRKVEPKRAVKVTITDDKGSVGNEWDFLLDDRIHKANVANFKGTILHYGETGKFKDFKDVIEYFDIDYKI
jgi:hypothetical protein